MESLDTQGVFGVHSTKGVGIAAKLPRYGVLVLHDDAGSHEYMFQCKKRKFDSASRGISVFSLKPT